MNEFGLDLLWLILLVLIYGFLTLSETALVALNDKALEKQAEQDHAARRCRRLLANPDRFLTTMKGERLMLAMLTGALCIHGPIPAATQWLRSLWCGVNAGLAYGLATVLGLLVMFFLLMFFGTTIPKYLAGRSYERTARLVCGPLSLLLRLTGWLPWGVSRCAKGMLRLLHMAPGRPAEHVTREEIRMRLEVGAQRGVIPPLEKAMIDNLFAFGERTAGELMTHRTEVVAIEVGSTLEEILEVAKREGYSRLPVYVESLDKIIGILYVKDLFPCVEGKKPFDLQALLHQPFIVPESKNADELFLELRRRKKYIAILIDEYGGTAGIVTMEDLTEAVMGSIFDEYDQEETEPIRQLGGQLLFDGGVPWEEAARALGLPQPEEDEPEEFETISGFLLAQLGRIPAPEEKPWVDFAGWRFQVQEMTGRRITQISATALPKPPADPEEA